MGSINRRDLKAYVRYDGSGRVVPGSLILRRNKPKVGTWQQVQGYECNSGGTQYQLSLLTEDTCSATVTYRSGVDNSNQTIELVDLNAEDYVIFCAVSGSVNVTDLFCDYDLAEIGQCGCSGEASPITFSGNTTTSTTTTTTTAGPAECPEDYTIGQAALGGTIAYILQSGDPGYDSNLQQGLVATIADISTGAQWGCFGTLITGADGIAIGTGNQNTIDIMAGCATAGIAARLCGDLVQGGYSDWYLPSKDELNKLYLNRVAIGGFSDFNYWSSSEIDLSSAWNQNFYYGNQTNYPKNYPLYVRAIRAFACTIPR
jgi:hypothetical protein